MMVDINISRLKYLLSLYRMKEEDLLSAINVGLKGVYKREQVFSEHVDFKILKKIDGVFNKGMAFYVDPSPLPQSGSMSVFFRKSSINVNLNFTSMKVVTEYESLKNYLSSLDVLADLNIESDLPHCTVKKDAKTMAGVMRCLLYPKEHITRPRDFLKAIIDNLSDHDVTVFEYLEAANKKEKANIDGFFLAPNFIVLKRHSYFKREIYTLLHELGHFLLNEEDVETLDVAELDLQTMSRIERWCNDFAYYFLVGPNDVEIQSIIRADGTNDYCRDIIDRISSFCFISRRAIYTRLLYDNKISRSDYDNVIADLNEQFALLQQKRHDQMLEQGGKKSNGMAPQPIYAKSFLQTISSAYYTGTIRDYDLYRMKLPARVINGLEKWL